MFGRGLELPGEMMANLRIWRVARTREQIVKNALVFQKGELEGDPDFDKLENWWPLQFDLETPLGATAGQITNRETLYRAGLLFRPQPYDLIAGSIGVMKMASIQAGSPATVMLPATTS